MNEERISGELLKGHIATLILAILDDQPRHGYDIMKTVSDRSSGVFELGQGTIYPLLYSLEEKRLICSKTKVVDGRRRRVYSLTAAGSRSCKKRKTQWDMFREAMNSVLEPSYLKGLNYAEL
ncbi:MAG: PadR family transcriptional regulator [Planctomycetota bacterium]|jgi:DNA-binding PadR family transcriptional regulator